MSELVKETERETEIEGHICVKMLLSGAGNFEKFSISHLLDTAPSGAGVSLSSYQLNTPDTTLHVQSDLINSTCTGTEEDEEEGRGGRGGDARNNAAVIYSDMARIMNQTLVRLGTYTCIHV